MDMYNISWKLRVCFSRISIQHFSHLGFGSKYNVWFNQIQQHLRVVYFIDGLMLMQKFENERMTKMIGEDIPWI